MVLVAGGVRSGKSAYAESLLATAVEPVCYVATYRPSHDDAEMAARIAVHRARRPAAWQTVQVGDDLAATIAALDAGAVLVDCLSVYVADALLRHGGQEPPPTAITATLAAVDAALAALRVRDGLRVVVSNEVGMGVVPPTPLGRAYRDALGWANQRAAAAADEVVMLELGIARTLKAP